jgi:hypothetical protein
MAVRRSVTLTVRQAVRIEGDEEIDGAVAALLDVSRGTEKSFRPLQRIGVDTAGRHLRRMTASVHQMIVTLET